MGVSNSGSGNRLLAAAGTSDLPNGPGYVCGSLADNRAAFVSTANGASGLHLRPAGNTLDFRPVPKLAGAAAFNARGEAISRDGRFWQNGKWFSPVSEENSAPSGTMRLHDLNDHGVMLASAGDPAGNGQTGMQHGAEAALIQTFDLDFIKPGTENDDPPVEIDEKLEDQEGEVVGINWDDDNHSEGTGGHGKLVFKNDYDDENGTEGEDDMIQLKLHAAHWPGTKARMKYDNTMVKIWRNANRTSEVKSEETEIDIGATQIVYLEGRKLTAAETPLKVEMQVKPLFGTNYAPGDKVSVHVATPIISLGAKFLPGNGYASLNLAEKLHKKDYMGRSRRDNRNNTVILKGKTTEGRTLWYSVDIFDLKPATIGGLDPKRRPRIKIREPLLDKEMKMALSLEGSHVVCTGHSNFGLGPNFTPIGTSTQSIDDYCNLTGGPMGGVTAIILRTNDPVDAPFGGNPMRNPDHGGADFAIREQDIVQQITNYRVPVPNVLKFTGKTVTGDELVVGSTVTLQPPLPDGLKFHYMQDAKHSNHVTVVKSSGDKPALCYNSCFMSVCNSGRAYSQTLEHGVLFYTRAESYAVVGAKGAQIPNDHLTANFSWKVSHYVELLVDGKSWKEIKTWLNENQYKQEISTLYDFKFFED
jgi:hypothetical protein